MKKIISLRWVFLAVWIVGLIALIMTSPDMNQLVREKGGYSFPDNYSSSIAGNLEKKIGGSGNGTTYLAVFHSEKGLSQKNMDAIQQTLQKVKNNKASLHIQSITDSFDNKSLKNELVSKNNKTLMAMLQIENNKNLSVHQERTAIDAQIKTNGVTTYLTGQQLINDDMSTAAQAGLQKTEWITVVFILVVLLLVFRSVVAPFIPLVSVGISYVVAQSVVAFLVKYFNFPISNFTQIFMVAIMFGIGTDYCILLLSRFKEELANGKDKYEATLNTFKTAGITVLHSGIPVFIAFLSLAFVQFSLYRSAVAVGVGVVFLLIALFTILPLFTVTLGNKLFWPMNKKIEQSKSGIWAWAGNLAFTRPIIALLIVALFTVPPIITYHGQPSFNSPEELPNIYASKAGFNVVSKDFGAGNISPATIYFQNDENMRSTDYVALMERLSEQISKDPHVDKVLSVSRPLGSRLSDIYVKNQAGTLHSGLASASNGLGQIKSNLSNTSKKIKSSQPQLNSAISNIGKLQAGTKATNSGISSMQSALSQISSGVKSGASGTSEIMKNIQSAKSQLAQLQSGESQIQNGYQQVAANLQRISDQLKQFSSSGSQPAIDTSQLTNISNQIMKDLTYYATTHQGVSKDPSFLKIESDFSQLSDSMNAIQTAITQQTQKAQAQINQLNTGIQSLADAMNQLNNQSAKISSGLNQFQTGMSQINAGLSQLENGLNKAGSGQDQVIAKMPQITDALNQIASGQNQMKTGFGQVQSQMSTLSSGLAQGSDGASKIQNGINTANSFIDNWTHLSYDNSGIYVPDSIFSNNDFKKSLDQYMSKDGKVASISVIMKDDPYSNKGISNFQSLKNQLPSMLKGTKLENAHIGIGGIASSNSDTQKMESSDYSRALTFVLIGVFIALVIVLRSLTMPIYLMASLLLTYLASLGFSELIFTKLFHYSGLSWTTPFFAFIILMALGIDYSIFVMTRFNEYANMAIKKRMLLTLWHMGNVIFSAVIILAGTFAAMLPSGMLSLMEIATTTIIGLALYAAVVIPLFVPVMVKFFGRGNWWPFIERKSNPLSSEENHAD
ncbi:MMPL family transporter [Sporolactobacillus shoreae]|uniref:MMPL family transporter n=1 Tax=Sporolactobacillus shoreae TaxID=1465501 RepID=A0A4Z0GMT3_9BACL|nr:MMPL family transporter [Sporolactobacillus shoreae]TGA97617.1 MMPL family transporter [Sporolactobacillus shoreae]